MKSLKNCSKGEPGGKTGISGASELARLVWLELTLTTAGSREPARSAKLSGAGRAYAWVARAARIQKAAPSRRGRIVG
jgi:hypothetical protein